MTVTLVVKQKTISYIEEFEDADIEAFGDHLTNWRFFKDSTGSYGSDELYAEWIGPSETTPDDIVLVWYGRKEQYWGVVKMNPDKYEVIGDVWVRKP